MNTCKQRISCPKRNHWLQQMIWRDQRIFTKVPIFLLLCMILFPFPLFLGYSYIKTISQTKDFRGSSAFVFPGLSEALSLFFVHGRRAMVQSFMYDLEINNGWLTKVVTDCSSSCVCWRLAAAWEFCSWREAVRDLFSSQGLDTIVSQSGFSPFRKEWSLWFAPSVFTQDLMKPFSHGQQSHQHHRENRPENLQDTLHPEMI